MEHVRLNNIGAAMLIEKKYSTALHYFKLSWDAWQANRFAPNEHGSVILFNIAKCHNYLGDKAKALNTVIKARELLADDRMVN